MEALEKVIYDAFDDFYEALQNDDYLKTFFINTDLQKLKQKQVKNFLEALQTDTQSVEKRFCELGHLHYKMGLPYSRYVKSFHVLLKSMVLRLPSSEEHFQTLEKIQIVTEAAINGSATGYLEEMIAYDLEIIHKLLDESISQKFVNEHLFWIERVCYDIKNKRTLPSVELDHTRCILGQWLHEKATQTILDAKELARLNAMHHKIHAIAKGVYDALCKKDYHALLIDYSFLVRHSQHINYELNQIVTQKDLIAKSQTDALTKLPNRKSLEIKAREIAQNKQMQFCVAMLDLDRFKEINDRYGHLCGDDVLTQTAQILKTSLRKSDAVFRYGGEEFLLIFNASSAKEILPHLEQLRNTIKQNVFICTAQKVGVTASIGVAQYCPNKHKTFAQLIHEADKALYEAKQNGRDKVVLATA
jgi:diguanylate cyclase (GGDEF)-like protein